MRRRLVAGNWKMNLNSSQAIDLATAVRNGAEAASGGQVDVAVCPPAIYLWRIADVLRGSFVALGAQNIYEEPSGAFTGEIAGGMVAETGARYVILGHSERRHTIGAGEDDWAIYRKTHAALEAGLTPILCVGETLAQRESEQTAAVLTFQIDAGMSGLSLDRPDQLVIAYEPVWAIGTGRNATPAQAQQAHALIRQRLRRFFGSTADAMRILYGGSVKPDNTASIMSQPDVDGGLIGGASLKADSFLAIVRETLAAKG